MKDLCAGEPVPVHPVDGPVLLLMLYGDVFISLVSSYSQSIHLHQKTCRSTPLEAGTGSHSHIWCRGQMQFLHSEEPESSLGGKGKEGQLQGGRGEQRIRTQETEKLCKFSPTKLFPKCWLSKLYDSPPPPKVEFVSYGTSKMHFLKKNQYAMGHSLPHPHILPCFPPSSTRGNT